MDAGMLYWSFAYLPSHLVPPISLFLSIFQGPTKASLPIASCLFQQEPWAGDWRRGGKEKPGVHLHPPVLGAESYPSSTPPAGLP